MSKELVALAPRTLGYHVYDDPRPVGHEVLIRTTVSGIKHGTELNIYRGTLPFASEIFDPVLRLFRPPNEGETIKPFFPHALGSWAAGVVEDVGPDVHLFKRGDRVHGEWRHRQMATKPETALYHIPTDVDDETMLFSDPARFALAAVHDAVIKLGDRVVVFGMGAIGLLALQMARLNGAIQVFAVDPLESRRAIAGQLGADAVFDPTADDVAIAVKQATALEGVDVAIEISGAYAALQQAIRCVHREGLVVTASYFGDTRGKVDLSREWHHNRVTLRSSMPVWDCSHRSQPMWDLPRVEQTAVGLLAAGKFAVKPLIGARIPFTRAAEAYRMIDLSPASAVKIILTYVQ